MHCTSCNARVEGEHAGYKKEIIQAAERRIQLNVIFYHEHWNKFRNLCQNEKIIRI